MPFEILPAIDLRGGRVVRLARATSRRRSRTTTTRSRRPRRSPRQVRRWLHVVDLDGARSGSPPTDRAIAAIVDGGRRPGERRGRGRAPGSSRRSRRSSTAGAARAVVGTAALADPAFAGRLVATHGADRIAVAIDVRDGLAVGHGWVADAPGVDVDDAIERLADAGVETFEVTAIERDGLLDGPDLAPLRAIRRPRAWRDHRLGGIATRR